MSCGEWLKGEVYVYGAGNGGLIFADMAEQNDYKVIGFIDDVKPGCIDPDDVSNKALVVPAIMNNRLRLAMAERFNVVGLVHRSAYIFPGSKIGEGTHIKPGATIGRNVTIGKCCIIDAGVHIEHDTVIGDGVFISVGSCIGSSIKIGDRSLIGIGCNLQTGITIGKDCTIVSGATVLTNVPDSSTVKVKL